MIGLSIIPRPQSVTLTSESFTLSPDTSIIADRPNRANAQYLQNLLSPATGYPLSRQDNGDTGICLKLQNAPGDLGEEGYQLEVKTDSVDIKAAMPHGVFNGLQTLLQLFPPEIQADTFCPGIEWKIPGLRIIDRPRFSWRGFMFDEGRHFHGKETVLKLLDVMASLKMNIFHWHLTEDQGWRVQIHGYPRLTEIGAQREGTSQSLWDMILDRHDGCPHGGYYTQDEIREIVTYAAQRHIMVVPEIEIPGHSTAALAAYPEFSCTGGPFKVGTRFGIFKDIFCPGKEGTFTFLQNILHEIIDLFPSSYIHIGGDEAPKARWKKCPDCQRRIFKEDLKDEQALQGYFTNRIANYLAGYDRTIIGWNQALSDDLITNALIQYWFGNRRGVIDAIRGGRKTVISSYLDYYLDHSYSLTPLSRTYNFEPVFDELSSSDVESIIGVEAPLWTEFVPDRARLDYQIFPRLLAVAETGWTAKNKKDFTDFRKRLVDFEYHLDHLGIRYARDRDVEPIWFKQLFGLLTIAQPQRKTAGGDMR